MFTGHRSFPAKTEGHPPDIPQRTPHTRNKARRPRPLQVLVCLCIHPNHSHVYFPAKALRSQGQSGCSRHEQSSGSSPNSPATRSPERSASVSSVSGTFFAPARGGIIHITAMMTLPVIPLPIPHACMVSSRPRTIGGHLPCIRRGTSAQPPTTSMGRFPHTVSCGSHRGNRCSRDDICRPACCARPHRRRSRGSPLPGVHGVAGAWSALP